MKCGNDQSSILELLGMVTVLATSERFVATEKLIGRTGHKFWTHFLYDDKIEEPIGQTSLCYHRLLKDSTCSQIITELGGEEKLETTLQEMFALIKKQEVRQVGDLLTDGSANIFYIRDNIGVLWSVRAAWVRRRWRVDAFPILRPRGWKVGSRVFSRKSMGSLDLANV